MIRDQIVFVYGAHETVWSGIARALLEQGGVIAAAFERCESFIAARLDWSFKEIFSRGGDIPECRMEAALAAVQLALTAAWGARVLLPAAAVGRCGGEFAAGHAIGALTFEDAIELGCRVSRVIEEGRGAGRMIAVRCPVAELARISRASPVAFSVVSDNEDDLTVLAVRTEDLPDVHAFLTAQDLEIHVTNSAIAPHTAAIEEWREEMTRPLSGAVAAVA
jgi:acyl transferase domain-containing protein